MNSSHRRSLSARSRQNLIETMKEEAFALAKCKIFAQKADQCGQDRLADLFDRTAEQHYLKHFAAHAELLGLLKTNEQQMNQALVEESLVVDIICRLFAQEARQDGDTEMAKRLNETRCDELTRRMELNDAFVRLTAPARTGKIKKARRHARVR
jgi:rubrerythrin